MYIPNPNRYQKMQYQRCGDSGLLLPKISFGLWHNFGNNCNYDNMKELIFTCFDHGITYFDLANNYGPEYGAAETNFGKILKEELMPYRDQLIISTKAGFDMWEGPYGNYGSRKYLMASIDQSLKRLQLDYVDIFYHHRMDPNTPLMETMMALADIVKMGKALYIGLSNYDGETLKKATEILTSLHVPFIVNQNCYNLFNREVEQNGLLKNTIALKKGFVVYSPLEQGLLSNRYINGIPTDSRIGSDGRYLNASNLTPLILKKIQKLNALAQSRNEKLATMALRWLLQKEGVTSVIIGASKKEQILEDLEALQPQPFSKDELDEIEKIVLSIE